MFYWDRSYFLLIWSMYKKKSLWFFFWIGNSHQFCTILKVLHFHECQEIVWKIQNKNCAMASVGSTVMALIAVTSLLLPLTSGVNWLSRGLWIVSMLSAFTSVAFSCKHQRFIGNLLLADKHDLWEFKKFLHDGKSTAPAKPKLKVVLLLSGTRTFFEHSLMLYTIGLGMYLGCLSQGGPMSKEADPGQIDNRNIFIWFLVFAFLYCFAYLLMEFLTNTRDLHSWACHLKWYDEYKVAPCLGETCNRKNCASEDYEDPYLPPKHHEDPDPPPKHHEKLPSRPWLLRVLLSWCHQTSRCKGDCLNPSCVLSSTAVKQQWQQCTSVDFCLRDPQSGSDISTRKDLVVEYYFAEWCPHCKSGSPVSSKIEKLSQPGTFKNVNFVNFNVDVQTTKFEGGRIELPLIHIIKKTARS